MLRPFLDVLRRFRHDERGNFFVLFGASAIPLLLVMGGAVDLTRFARYKTDLSYAVDSAALALARRGQDFDTAEAKAFVTKYVAAMLVKGSTIPTSIPFTIDGKFTVTDFNVQKTDKGYSVATTASMQTIFLPLGALAKPGMALNSMPMNLFAEAVHSSNRLEVAMVLDVTGSMNCGNSTTGCDTTNWSNPGSSSRIVALRSAANTLVDTLMKDDFTDPDMVKVAVVPFEGTVNIGSAYAENPPSWIDWSNEAKASWNGRNFEKYNFSTSAVCTSGSNCKWVGHKWLFEQLTSANSSVKWAGCVEARAEPYDTNDTTPVATSPDTLFVPFFWPDEPDRKHASQTASPYQYASSPNTQYNSNYKTGSNGSSTNNSYNYNYHNNYLQDKTAPSAGDERPGKAQKYLLKYKYTSSSNKAAYHTSPSSSNQLTATTTFPYASGPNRGCPQPIVPLTNDKTAVKTAITNLVAYAAMGTFVPIGLAWGWHVLSPTEPFAEGVAPGSEHYDKTVKALVLFSDGDNSVTAASNHNGSYFSAYNYLSQNRLGSSTSASDATDGLDTKTATLCANAKTAGIRLYTITFGSMTTATQTLMQNCATEDKGEKLHYHAPTTSALADIFAKIGEDLTEIHLAM